MIFDPDATLQTQKRFPWQRWWDSLIVAGAACYRLDGPCVSVQTVRRFLLGRGGGVTADPFAGLFLPGIKVRSTAGQCPTAPSGGRFCDVARGKPLEELSP